MTEERLFVEEALDQTTDLIIRYAHGEPVSKDSLDKIYQLIRDCSEKLSDQILRMALGNIISYNLSIIFSDRIAKKDDDALRNLLLTFHKIYISTGCDISYFHSTKGIYDAVGEETIEIEDEVKELEREFANYKIKV